MPRAPRRRCAERPRARDHETGKAGCEGRAGGAAAEPRRQRGVSRLRRRADRPSPRGVGADLRGVIVLDTHAWLWSLAAPNKLSRAATRAIDRADPSASAPRRSTSSPTSSRGGGYGSTLRYAHGFATLSA